MPLSLAQLHEIREAAYADDIEIDFSVMANWSEAEAQAYFEDPSTKPVPKAAPPPLARPTSYLLVRTLFSTPKSPPRESPSRTHPRHTAGLYDWLVERIASGEAAAVLSLAGNVAAGPMRQPGEEYTYVLRTPDGAGTCASISAPFAYTLLATCGPECDGGRAVLAQRDRRAERGAHPPNGRLGAAAPEHARDIVLAFRGVRPAQAGSEDAGPSSDRSAFRDFRAVAAAWLPKDVRVHAGALAQHGALWDDLVKELVVLEMAVRTKQCACELLFAGLSLGGTVAQLTAWRAALHFEALRPCIRVLTFGAVAWGNARACAAFDACFGRRAVQLLLSRSLRAGAASGGMASAGADQPTWWVGDAEAALASPVAAASRPRTLWSRAKRFFVHRRDGGGGAGARTASEARATYVYDPLGCCTFDEARPSYTRPPTHPEASPRAPLSGLGCEPRRAF